MVMTKPIFDNEADILADTYYHTCTVKRPKKSARKYLDEFVYDEVYKDIPCAISFSQGSSDDLSNTTQEIQYMAKLFAGPEYNILAGDMIYADVLGHPYEFRAGEGYPYQSHIEVPLIRNEVA